MNILYVCLDYSVNSDKCFKILIFLHSEEKCVSRIRHTSQDHKNCFFSCHCLFHVWVMSLLQRFLFKWVIIGPETKSCQFLVANSSLFMSYSNDPACRREGSLMSLHICQIESNIKTVASESYLLVSQHFRVDMSGIMAFLVDTMFNHTQWN